MFDIMRTVKNGGSITEAQVKAALKKYPLQGDYDTATGAKNVWTKKDSKLFLNGEPFTGVKSYEGTTINPDYGESGKAVYYKGKFIDSFAERCWRN